MDYRNIKVHVPTPEISKLVQEKLFEEGYQWDVGGQTVRETDSNYLYTSGDRGKITYGSTKKYFQHNFRKQVHYLQVLVGDDSGTLFKYYLNGEVIYKVGETHYWVSSGKLHSVINRYNRDPADYIILNVNEEEIMQDNSNEMPKLEAGKHVIRDNHGALHLILDTELEGISGFAIGGGRGFDAIDSENYITEVHRIFDVRGALCESCYNESTLIWKRDDKAAEARKQYEELQRQIKQLQEQADKLGEKL